MLHHDHLDRDCFFYKLRCIVSSSHIYIYFTSDFAKAESANRLTLMKFEFGLSLMSQDYPNNFSKKRVVINVRLVKSIIVEMFGVYKKRPNDVTAKSIKRL